MSSLTIKPASACRFDEVSLGEVMVRLDPGEGRIHTTRSFQVWEGGGEYNVARAMRKCWGKRATAVTALPVNDLGWLVEDLMMQGGVDTSKIIWREFDGLGRNTRVGLNFTEKGFGIRAACSAAAIASPATRYLDLDGSLDLARDVARGGFLLENGMMRAVDAPGLGVAPI